MWCRPTGTGAGGRVPRRERGREKAVLPYASLPATDGLLVPRNFQPRMPVQKRMPDGVALTFTSRSPPPAHVSEAAQYRSPDRGVG